MGGVSTSLLAEVANDMGGSEDKLWGILHLQPRPDIPTSDPSLLYSDEASRVAGLARLIGQVEVMVIE